MEAEPNRPRPDQEKRSAPRPVRKSPKKRLKKPPVAAKPELKLGELPDRGSFSNFRALLRVPEEPVASAGKPPTLKRNGSSNSVLADLSKGVLSRSSSFVAPGGKGVTRSNSIVSLLCGMPTAMRESNSTDRLMLMDGAEDRVMTTLKNLEGVGNANTGAGAPGPSAAGAAGLGDRTFSFGQLQHMGLDELEDPSAVALSLPDQKWGDG